MRLEDPMLPLLNAALSIPLYLVGSLTRHCQPPTQQPDSSTNDLGHSTHQATPQVNSFHFAHFLRQEPLERSAGALGS